MVTMGNVSKHLHPMCTIYTPKLTSWSNVKTIYHNEKNSTINKNKEKIKRFFKDFFKLKIRQLSR